MGFWCISIIVIMMVSHYFCVRLPIWGRGPCPIHWCTLNVRLPDTLRSTLFLEWKVIYITLLIFITIGKVANIDKLCWFYRRGNHISEVEWLPRVKSLRRKEHSPLTLGQNSKKHMDSVSLMRGVRLVTFQRKLDLSFIGNRSLVGKPLQERQRWGDAGFPESAGRARGDGSEVGSKVKEVKAVWGRSEKNLTLLSLLHICRWKVTWYFYGVLAVSKTDLLFIMYIWVWTVLELERIKTKPPRASGQGFLGSPNELLLSIHVADTRAPLMEAIWWNIDQVTHPCSCVSQLICNSSVQRGKMFFIYLGDVYLRKVTMAGISDEVNV